MSEPASNPLHDHYRLGCPVWACESWRGSLFAEKAPRRDFLRQYSTGFATVEGNAVFYGLPSLDTARRWAAETADGFRFALKFPRAISHEGPLTSARGETAAFLEVLEVMAGADRLGPSLLQLPPGFDGRRFDELRRYLQQLPDAFPYAVEVRHPDWFDDGPVERSLDDLLRERGIDRAIFDSRALFSRPATDDFETKSQSRKPLVPLRHTVTGTRPFVRFIGRNDLDLVEPWIEEWADVVSGWIDEGLSPYVFTHAPDDRFAPAFARQFHEALRVRLPELPPLPNWIGEQEARRPVQQSLF